MKRSFLSLLGLFIIFSASAQDSLQIGSSPRRSRIQIGVNFSPDICYRELKNNNGSQSSDKIISNRDEREKASFGFTTGLNACYDINRVLSIEAGIQFSQKGYRIPPYDLFVYPPMFNPPVTAEIAYRYTYIDIPVRANILLGNRKIRFIGSAGVVANFFIKETSKSIVYYADDSKKVSKGNSKEFENWNFSPMISAGINYCINQQMNLRIEPTFRYGVMKIIDQPITAYLYNAGLNIGYYVRL
jgi:hypothetical protein